MIVYKSSLICLAGPGEQGAPFRAEDVLQEDRRRGATGTSAPEDGGGAAHEETETRNVETDTNITGADNKYRQTATERAETASKHRGPDQPRISM